jgi:hypothetical protein
MVYELIHVTAVGALYCQQLNCRQAELCGREENNAGTTCEPE